MPLLEKLWCRPMSPSDAMALSILLLTLVAHAWVLWLGRRVPVWLALLCPCAGLSMAALCAAVFLVSDLRPKLTEPYVAEILKLVPVLFLGSLTLISLGGAHWLGRAWSARKDGVLSGLVRAFFGIALLASSLAIFFLAMVWLGGHLGDPGPAGFHQRYG